MINHLANIGQFLRRSYSLEKLKGHVKLDHMEYLSLRPEQEFQLDRVVDRVKPWFMVYGLVHGSVHGLVHGSVHGSF